MTQQQQYDDAKKRKQGSTAFSFADFGFWRLAAISFTTVVLAAIIVLGVLVWQR
jgi:hypothetical protein